MKLSDVKDFKIYLYFVLKIYAEMIKYILENLYKWKK